MPLLDHFHAPLHPPRPWEGFHHAWATSLAEQLNHGLLPPGWYAEPEISLGPTMEIDVATIDPHLTAAKEQSGTLTWAPPRPKAAVTVDFAHFDGYGVHVYQDLGGAELRAAIELVSPANKDREGSLLVFAAKCAGHLKHGVGLMVVDIVTARSGNLHADLLKVLEVKSRHSPWASSTDLYAIAYRPVTVRKKPRIEIWPEVLTLGKQLPVLPLWLTLDLSVPVDLEESYLSTCRALRIPA